LQKLLFSPIRDEAFQFEERRERAKAALESFAERTKEELQSAAIKYNSQTTGQTEESQEEARQDLISRYDEKSPTLITKEKNMIEEIVQVAQKRKESDRHDRISTNLVIKRAPAEAELNTSSTQIERQIESKRVEQDSTHKNTDNSELERQPENKLDAHLTLTEDSTVTVVQNDESFTTYYLAGAFLALAIGTVFFIKS